MKAMQADAAGDEGDGGDSEKAVDSTLDKYPGVNRILPRRCDSACTRAAHRNLQHEEPRMRV